MIEARLHQYPLNKKFFLKEVSQLHIKTFESYKEMR